MNTIILAVRANAKRLMIAGAIGVIVALSLVVAIALRDRATTTADRTSRPIRPA